MTAGCLSYCCALCKPNEEGQKLILLSMLGDWFEAADWCFRSNPKGDVALFCRMVLICRAIFIWFEHFPQDSPEPLPPIQESVHKSDDSFSFRSLLDVLK